MICIFQYLHFPTLGKLDKHDIEFVDDANVGTVKLATTRGGDVTFSDNQFDDERVCDEQVCDKETEQINRVLEMSSIIALLTGEN